MNAAHANRFFSLVVWELRHLRGQRRGASAILLALVWLLAGALVWVLADGILAIPEPVYRWLAPLLVGTTYRDPVAELSQLGFGYALLRITVDLMVAFAHLALPA